MPPPDRKPDAVLCPRPYAPAAGYRDPAAVLKRDFKPVLGLRTDQHIYARPQGNQYFVTADPNDSIIFGKDHDLAGRERYDWYVAAPDGMTFNATPYRVPGWQDEPGTVKLGWLRDLNSVVPMASPERRAFNKAVSQRAGAFEAVNRRRGELKALGVNALSKAEAQELAELDAAMTTLEAEGPGRLDVPDEPGRSPQNAAPPPAPADRPATAESPAAATGPAPAADPKPAAPPSDAPRPAPNPPGK